MKNNRKYVAVMSLVAVFILLSILILVPKYLSP
jgi:hypothetical protein